jgi:hypothetical protein
MTTPDLPDTPNPPIFTLDLGANGGVLSPTSARELLDWVQAEQTTWNWLGSVPNYGHKGAISQCITALNDAAANAQEAVGRQLSDPRQSADHAENARRRLHDAFVVKRLPHSSTPLAQRIQQLAKADVVAAAGYMFPFLAETGDYRFDGANLSSWRGFLEGLVDHFGILGDERNDSIQGALLESLDALRVKADSILSEKTTAINALHRSYDEFMRQITSTDGERRTEFSEFMQGSKQEHDETLSNHKDAISNLERTFREKMALRAPVEYWQSRKDHHGRRVKSMGLWTFGSMAALALMLALGAAWVQAHLGADGKPDAWRVGVLAIVAVLGVWAVRLIVRMFLSHTHLETDAAERVTMVQTYLSLLEGDKLPTDEDRKLILQALFRPASDGLVKDEGMPLSAVELLTRLK